MSSLRSPVVAAIASAALTATVVGGVAMAQPSTNAAVPPSATVTNGNRSATFPVTGVSPGPVTITATQDGVSLTASTEVVAAG